MLGKEYLVNDTWSIVQYPRKSEEPHPEILNFLGENLFFAMIYSQTALLTWSEMLHVDSM